MDCEICKKCVVGNTYTLASGHCDGCKEPVHPTDGTYLGMHDNRHIFRVHPKFVCNCGKVLRYAALPCNGINVTSEFESVDIELYA